MTKGIITGDLVNSTDISVMWRQKVVDALETCVMDFSSLSPTKMEMYRGDSFQIVADKPELTLSLAVAIRAALRASTPEKNEKWDARVSVGIGDVSFESGNIVTSDGEAFRLSGRSLDAMGKKRLVVSTPWNGFDESIELVTRFADDVISSWTSRQAQVAYHSLLFRKTQREMAAEMGLTTQNFNSHWSSAKVQLILDYLEYYKSLCSQYSK